MSRLSKQFLRRQKRNRHLITKRNYSNRLRIAVFKSNKGGSVQIIDDIKQATLFSISYLMPEYVERLKEVSNKWSDYKVKWENDYSLSLSDPKSYNMAGYLLLGEMVGEKCKEFNKKLVFDRGGWAYHGKLRCIAEAIRRSGGEI